MRLIERAYLSPIGSGYLSLPGTIIGNPIPGIPGVPLNTPLDFRTPTAFPGNILLFLLPTIRAKTIETLKVNPNNTDLSVRTIDVFKTGTELFANDFTPGQAQHFSLGVQRQLNPDFAISADFVYRHFLHQQIRDVDLNHFNRYVNGVQKPVVPVCPGDLVLTPKAPCSNGGVGLIISGGRTDYRGLLVKLDKRFTHRYQMQVSYALQARSTALMAFTTMTIGFNITDRRDRAAS